MDYNLSPWFSEETPPVRPGVYEREVFHLNDGPRYAYFNGSFFCLWETNPEKAWKIAQHSHGPSSLRFPSKRRWRGILPETA